MKLYDFGLAVIFHAVGIAVTPQRELGERDHSFSGKNHHEKKKKKFFVCFFVFQASQICTVIQMEHDYSAPFLSEILLKAQNISDGSEEPLYPI